VIYNFFAGCHGKGPCDGHLGVLKRMCKIRIKSEPIEDVYDLIKVINEQKNTKSVLFEVDLNDKKENFPFKKGTF